MLQELHHLSTVIDEGKGDVTLHSMKGGPRNLAPLFLNLSIRSRWVVNFTPQPGNELRYLLNRRLGDFHSAVTSPSSLTDSMKQSPS